MNHVFLDANILLDFYLNRQPHSNNTTRLFEMKFEGKIEIYFANISIPVMYYLMSKYENHETAIRSIRSLKAICNMMFTSNEIMEQAIASDWSDLEDAIQYYTAISNPKIDVIISRDKKGFKKSKLKVLTADELLKL